MPPTRATHRARILRVLDAAPEGLTCKQIERMTGIRHTTASAALTGLAEQMKVFRLEGFRKPYHWITPQNLRGRTIIGKPLSRKDALIEYQRDMIRALTTPQNTDTVEPKSVVAPLEQEQSIGTHA